MTLKEALAVYGGSGIFVQSFLNTLNHVCFHIWKWRDSRLLEICEKQSNTLELMKHWFVGWYYRNTVLYLKIHSLLTSILSLLLIPLSVKVMVHWNCPLTGNDFHETNTLLYYY